MTNHVRRESLFAVLLAVLALAFALLLPGCAGGTPDGNAQMLEQEAIEDTDASSFDGMDSADAEAGGKAEAGSETGASGQETVATSEDVGGKAELIDEDGTYTSKEDVALYLHTYGYLPTNFVTKDEAEDAGWKTEGLSLDEACPGMSIGGDRFGNREGKLPSAKGRTWYECDIDYNGGRSRNAKRIVYSNDGLIYYTEDHYETFEQLY